VSFCFRYLYDSSQYDSTDDWLDYKQIVEYLVKNYDIKFIEAEFAKIYETDEQI